MPEPEKSGPFHPALSAAIAAGALALLVALPFLFDTPDSPLEIAAALATAVALIALAAWGVAGFLRHRRRSFADSILPPPDPRERKELKRRAGAEND